MSNLAASSQNNVSSVAFKIYEPVVPTSSPYTFAICDVEHTLRNEGLLVYADSVRRALWCFSLVGSDGSSNQQTGTFALDKTLKVGDHSLFLVDEGMLEPISLLKSRTPNLLNTPSTSSSAGPPFDSAFRSVTTPAGAMPATSLTAETDVKPSVGSTVESQGYGATPTKEIHEYFITSVVASLSQRFCSETGAIPLDSKSFLLPSSTALADQEVSQTSSASILAALRVHLTTTGTLLIGISLTLAKGVHANGHALSPLKPAQSGVTVLAAPFGMLGTLHTLVDSDLHSLDGSIAQSPDTQVTRFRPDAYGKLGQWQNICSKLLEVRGISTAILSGTSWLSIHFLRSKQNESRTDGKVPLTVNPNFQIMWPAVLCYRKRSTDFLPKLSFDSSNITLQEEFDAMKYAEAWFMGNAERDEILAKRKQEREAADATKEAGQTDPRLLQSGFVTQAPRRSSNAGAAGGAMYPTPPDGVQSASGMPPFIDGSTSSPGTQVPSAGMVDLDPSLVVSGASGDVFGEGWEGTQSKREQSFNQANWDLNQDVFVENDITDDDFNFFDEQPNAMDMTVPDIPELGNSFSKGSDQALSQENWKPAVHVDMKNATTPAPAVFAKPELKHARSTLGELRQREKGKARPANGIKRPLSPFNYTTVYKKLKASFDSRLKPATTGSGRRGSAFDKLDVDRSFTVVNKKYEHNGRFNFREDPAENTPTTSSPPTTNYLRQHGRGRATLKNLPTNLGAQVAGIAGIVDNDHFQRDIGRADESTSDADDISLVSDQDDMSDYSDEPSSPTKTSIRRRRPDDVESIAPSIKDLDHTDDQFLSGTDLSRLFINDSLAVPMSSYLTDPEPMSPRAILSDEEFIMVAQLLTEQAVSGSVINDLSLSKLDSLDISGPDQEIMINLRSSLQTLQAVLPSSLQSATACPLRQLVDVQDVPLLATPSRIQPRPPAGGPDPRPGLVQIHPPHLELRRYDTKLSVLPSSLSFWESLGLGPCQGPKDIYSVSVFPNLEGMADSADEFLDRLRITYESMKLGSFERMTTSNLTVPNGLVPYEVDKMSHAPILTSGSRSKQPLVDEMAKLAVAIFHAASAATPPRNFVVFFVYSPENPTTIIESCLAFVRMLELYRRAITERKRPSENELVLQLVPLDSVATPNSMVVLTPSECIRLCLEVYDRCNLFGGPMPSPAIVLEPLPVQAINFALRGQPSANVLQENSVMHIAYAQSVDDRWITAAWTDNCGRKQMTASYCLGRKDRALTRTFTDIAHEIWTTTHDLTSMWKVHWRIVVTKVGSMDQQEIQDWVTLAGTEAKSSVTLALLTVNTSPSLQLLPAITKVSTTAQSAFYSTPVSTPQPSTMSPEHSSSATNNPSTPKPVTASTPGADNTATEADADASLVDVTDTTWGAIVSHRLNTSHSLTDLSPSLISGYLIKRGGSRVDDPPAVMEVNVVHCEGNPRGHDLLLREMLSVFRGLGTLARARSVTEKEGDVRPWHVAAAEKGIRALYQLM